MFSREEEMISSAKIEKGLVDKLNRLKIVYQPIAGTIYARVRKTAIMEWMLNMMAVMIMTSPFLTCGIFLPGSGVSFKANLKLRGR